MAGILCPLPCPVPFGDSEPVPLDSWFPAPCGNYVPLVCALDSRVDSWRLPPYGLVFYVTCSRLYLFIAWMAEAFCLGVILYPQPRIVASISGLSCSLGHVPPRLWSGGGLAGIVNCVAIVLVYRARMEGEMDRWCVLLRSRLVSVALDCCGRIAGVCRRASALLGTLICMDRVREIGAIECPSL